MPTHHTKPKLKTTSTKVDSRAPVQKASRAGKARTFSLIISWLFPYGLSQKRWLRRTIIGFVSLLLIATAGMYAEAEWYIHSQAGKPYEIGTSFIPDYASSLGVNPEQTLDALLGIGVKHLRLVSYWSDGEPTPGHYDFSQLDWQFQKAEAAHAKITLTVGLRQPRWPECHMPDWAASEPTSVWEPQLKQYMAAVVERYKNSPSLVNYQVENEYFLQGFGDCNNFDRSRLVSEYNLVKSLDPKRPIIVTRSNNDQGTPIGAPTPDEFGVSVYKRTWDANVTKRYLEYPYPAWLYGFLAGTQEIINHKNMKITELQAEAWPPNGKTIPNTSLAEQNKSFYAARFQARVAYGKATGMHQIDLWGGEYWYYRLVVLHDPSLWNVAKQTFQDNQ